MRIYSANNILSLLDEIFPYMLSLFKFNLTPSDTPPMNRFQFFTVTGLSTVFALLVIGHIALSLQVQHGQANWSAAQQVVQQGNIFQTDLRQLAARILSDSQHSADPGLKDLVAREQITYTPNNTNATETPATPSH